MKINRGKILLLVTGIISGILLMIFISNNPIEFTKILNYNQYKDVQSEINSLRSETKGLYKKYNELEKKLIKYQKSGDNKNKKVNETMEEELENVKLFYGITKVKGPGITITLNDNIKESYMSTLELNNSVVHNVDIYKAVNELRNSGAEAIAVNGYRVVGESKITCEGPIIMIDGESIVPPFVIDAIGDISALEYTVESGENKFGNMKLRGLLVGYESFKEKTLPAYNKGSKNLDSKEYMKEVIYK